MNASYANVDWSLRNTEIAARLGVRPAAVSEARRRHGAPHIPTNARRMGRGQAAEAFSLLCGGKTTAEIGRRFGVSYKSVIRALEDWYPRDQLRRLYRGGATRRQRLAAYRASLPAYAAEDEAFRAIQAEREKRQRHLLATCESGCGWGRQESA